MAIDSPDSFWLLTNFLISSILNSMKVTLIDHQQLNQRLLDRCNFSLFRKKNWIFPCKVHFSKLIQNQPKCFFLNLILLYFAPLTFQFFDTSRKIFSDNLFHFGKFCDQLFQWENIQCRDELKIWKVLQNVELRQLLCDFYF